MTEETAVLDMSVVEELRASVDGDDEFVAEVVGAYLEEGPTHLAAMHSAAEAGDVEAVVRPAHTLKSSSAAIGAMRLASICREIELAGRQGEADELVERVGDAQAAWATTVAALEAAGLK